VQTGRANQITKALAVLTASILFATTDASAEKYIPITLADNDLLDSGNLLITDAGPNLLDEGSGIYEIDRSGEIIWSYTGDLRWAHNADRQDNGDVIISDTGNDRVIIINETGTILWDTDNISFSDGSQLQYPNDANLLANGNRLITDRDNHRVIEVTESGNIVWQFGETGIPRNDSDHLFGPHNADRLTNGNTIIADSINRRVIEVDSTGTIVWQYADSLDWPRDADRLENGNTLINDSNNYRLIEVTPDGQIVWEHLLPGISYDSNRLPSGNTLYDSGQSLYEVDPTGEVVWEYPPPSEEVWVLNPTSGVDLYCNIHRPSDFDSEELYPAVVLVPGGSGNGENFKRSGKAQRFAELGFIVMRFDPDGRGQSTNGGSYTYEDDNGFVQQDGLRAVVQHLIDLPETDDANVGVFTFSYGITMGAGALGRYPQDPPVKFIIEWEGPSDRTDTAWPNGHLYHDIDDEPWWYEREPINFIDDFNGYLLVVQTEQDHAQTNNQHSMDINNYGTNTDYGGSGRCLWTRINSEFGDTNNQPNSIYSFFDRPEWLAESVDTEALTEQYLVEMSQMPAVPLSLVATPLHRGHIATLTTTDASPDSTVYFVYSLTGEGSTYIPILGIDLDINAPISLIGSATADNTGTAELTGPVPQSAPLISIWLQSVQRLPGNGALKSNVIATEIVE